MSLSDALDAARPPKIEPKETPVPKGWERGYEQTGQTGILTSGPVSVESSPQLWEDLLKDWGIDPATVEIVGSPKVKGWDSPVAGTKTGETIRLRSYSVSFKSRATVGGFTDDIKSLCDYVRKRKPPRKQPPPVEDIERAFLVLIADWQAGKNEGDGAGSEAFVDRVLIAFDRTIKRLAELKRNGRECQVVYLVGLGDLVEGCSGNYASQAWSTDLTRREQITLVVDLLVKLTDMVVDAGYRVVLSGVAGNHGEHRNGSGKAFTTEEDNDDLLVIEMAGRVFAGNPERYAAVSVYLPDQLSMSLDIAGVVCGFYHGHIGSPKTNTLTKLAAWWTGQIVGNVGPTAHASILFSGHYHHLFISEGSGRTHIQAPAMDGGSRWFREATGKTSAPGFLTMTIGGPTCGPRGFDDLRVA
jgi:hypothetical protein